VVGVVRLGAQDQGFVPKRFRILQGQGLHLQYISDTAAIVRAWARLYYDNGLDSILYVPDQTMTGDRIARVLAPSDVAISDGWVVDAVVECVSDGVKRGQAYVKLNVALPSLIFGTVLCADYVYSTFGQVALGTYVQPGPGGGGGNLNWAVIKANGAPAGVTIFALGVSNTIRKVREIIWYYSASSDVASRVLQMKLRRGGAGLPTGFPTTGHQQNVWGLVSNMTLTGDQDGIMFVDQGRSGFNDNGTLTIDSAADNPTPLPLLVPESGDRFVELIITDEEVLDFDLAWGLFEDWVIL